MADDNITYGVCCGCCLLILFVFFMGGGSSDSSYSSSSIVADTNTSDYNPLPILNYTNMTIKPDKINFVYFDHNSSDWETCYGLNYTIITDSDGNNFYLDHAETDILANETNYTFTYPDGICVIYDNNTETEIYNNTDSYYVHELRDDEGKIIKSEGNFTLNNKDHYPDVIPGEWIFNYRDEGNISFYHGDEDLYEAYVTNKLNNSDTLRLNDKAVNGLMYYSKNNTDAFKYGFRDNGGYCWDDVILSNGTVVYGFDIEEHNHLSKGQKAFIQNYDARIGEVMHREYVNAVYEAEDDMEASMYRYNDNHKYSYYYSPSSSTYGVIYSP